MAQETQLSQQQQMEMYVKQFSEFMAQYNRVTDMCFNDCATDFTTRNVLASENSCSINCLEKYLKVTQRISERFGEHHILNAENPAAAAANLGMKK